MAQSFTLTAITENSPGVLHRITDLFTRRKINIESLSVSETEKKGVSRFTIVVKTEKDLAEKVVKQIKRVVEVLDAYVCRDSHLILREGALIKVNVEKPEDRAEIEALVSRYDAEVLLEAKGIVEFIRSGRIALLKKRRTKGEKYLD